ncbi:MAG: beta-galactosidase domain 4-containing protein, partial [Actinomycetes bacterium]
VDGVVVGRGAVDVGDLAPQTSRIVDLSGDPAWQRWAGPSGATGTLTVEWIQRRRTEWCATGAIVGWDQLDLPLRATRGRSASPVTATPLPAGERAIDRAAWTPTVFRALTDNDGLRVGWLRGIQGQTARLVDAWGVDRARWDAGSTRRSADGADDVTVQRGHLRAAGRIDPDTPVPAVTVRRELRARPDGWTRFTLNLQVPRLLTDLPRVGVELQLPGEWERLEWLGAGPMECYPDRRAAARFGRWTSTVSEQYVDFVVPQEHGHHEGLEWLAVRGSGGGLLVVRDQQSGPLGWAARHHSDAALFAATHTDELSPLSGAQTTWLYLDAAVRGLGSAACGPDALPQYRVGTGAFTISAWCRDLGPRDDAAALAGVVRAGGLDVGD